MNILAIESSCDDTAVAIIQDGNRVLANTQSSQLKAHQKFGGIVPELAARMHTEKIHFLIKKALHNAALTLQDMDLIAVTSGPGLEGALLIGLSAAKALAATLQIPLLPINHLHGHIYATFLSDSPPTFPLITLLVSGGHTILGHCEDHFKFTILGQTRDDAVGEAFDKVARALGLGYPGGPLIEAMATQGDPTTIAFPRAMIRDGLDFSFSGLKTSVIQKIAANPTFKKEDICASFQAAVSDILTQKALDACLKTTTNTLILCGGVSANRYIQNQLQRIMSQHNITVITPQFDFCTDNAAMIGACAYHRFNTLDSIPKQEHLASPNLSLGICPL